jgi:hypothetical protein
MLLITPTITSFHISISPGRAVAIVQSPNNGAAEAFRVSTSQYHVRCLIADSNNTRKTVIIECNGRFTIPVQRELLNDNFSFFARQLFHFKRRTASGLCVLQTNLPRRSLKRYALWLCGSSEYATFDPSLTAPELFLRLSNLHITAGILRDDAFGNDLMGAMLTHLFKRSDEMLLGNFLVRDLQTNAKGSAAHKLIADWVVWSNEVSEAKLMSLFQRVQDRDLCYEVAKAVLRKTGKEWEGNFLPPYLVSPCLYHTHPTAVNLSYSAKREVGACGLT